MLRREYESLSLRRWFAARYEIEVGLYSYGCFDPLRVSGRTRIGRYCSIAPSARIVGANHPLDALTTHPYLYDAGLGVIAADRLDPAWLTIGDDVWIGHNATVMPGCKSIGRGAVIGTGAVVTQAVEPYTIVAGVPARLLRRRFTPEVIAAIEATRWWDNDKAWLRRLAAAHPAAAYAPDAAALAEVR
ncbi:CatB-related O-acetyltransferase [Glacieibacterium frigidum]|uniref:CatB-related O-acetyltransferase n=1 Tax=Glacieibacterium frigidum TaxID=2593303 RepID=UPI001F490DCE|nr:CatB-related O-acetyltransferase [Glacieibacterium frigidum]